MIKQVKFTKILKRTWNKQEATKAVHHHAGLQFYVDDILINMVPYSQITKITYEE